MTGSFAKLIAVALQEEGYAAEEAEQFLSLIGATEDWIGERNAAREMGIGHTTLYRWRNGEGIKRTKEPFPGSVKWRVTPAGVVQYERGSVRRYMLSLTRFGAVA